MALKLKIFDRLLVRYRFRRMTAHFDRAIREARRRHMPVNHIQQAKRDFLHEQLRGFVSARREASHG